MKTNFLAQLINVFLLIVETSLSLRFLMKFFGANSNAPFAKWLYNNTQPLLSPFVNIFPAPEIQSQFTIEFTSLFAIIIYMIIGYTIIEILEIIFSSARESTYNKKRG